ncbi:MAG: hypoxanthine phosphoribosyltransferase [Planctomycetes bacterium]|nr:hypoxanthine phosphoribosyltransferase [Planctomycetota bacterium]
MSEAETTGRFPPFRVLLSRDEILRRIHELVRQLTADLGEGYADGPPCLVAVVEGARPLARTVQRLLPGALPVHEIKASSYGSGTESAGTVEVLGGRDIPCAGRTVILIEDIVDTGRTIARLREHFRAAGALHCRVLTLLDKPSRRVADVVPDYIGFDIPDEFVIGFGMDIAGRYRELPDIVIYDAEIEKVFERTALAE